jgi:hypothetical protein
MDIYKLVVKSINWYFYKENEENIFYFTKVCMIITLDLKYKSIFLRRIFIVVVVVFYVF